ncbi:MAG: hypothetical protein IH988_02830 [Planctomycetes bacterium]|nr:hypothetical protein [Planctomycetota bacterium]
MECKRFALGPAVGLSILTALAPATRAWDETGHTIVTELASRLIPPDMPAFLRTPEHAARLRYLATEPDRWRNTRLAPMGHVNKPEHYFDIDLLELYELTPETLPRYGRDFIAAMAVYKSKHADKDFHYDRSNDREHAREWPGLAPYRICEMFVKLRSSWQTLNTYQKYADVAGAGTIDTCRANIIHYMGLMSHYVGDLAQPLHTTKHYNGWIGENPNGFTTADTFHALIDTGVIRDASITVESCWKRSPARMPLGDDARLFESVMDYTVRSFSLVESIYQHQKDGAFDKDSPDFARGVNFVEQRLCAGAIMLESLWEGAYRDAGIDSFRERRLIELRHKSSPVEPAPTGG